jgi:hypothetical protein
MKSRSVKFLLIALFTVISLPAPAQSSTQHLYKIYSNLGKTVHGTCYNTSEGWKVGMGQSIAMPFTPKVDAKLNELVLGLFGSPGAFAIVSVNKDDNGLPGKAIHTWVVGDLGMHEWHSCYVGIAKVKKGLPLQGGTQYWVVTAAPYSTTDAWYYTYNDSEGDFAYKEGTGGWNSEDSYLSAFGVFGTEAK